VPSYVKPVILPKGIMNLNSSTNDNIFLFIAMGILGAMLLIVFVLTSLGRSI